MTRCDYDAVFYRVFCVTLLAIAFTFTVILTNVFIDIDGLLSSKQGKHKTRIISDTDVVHEDYTPAPISNDDMNYGDNEDSYRTKRSIETQNFLFHIKNPKIKNILTNRLATLLEALDAEESSQNIKRDRSNNIPKEELKDTITVIDEEKDDEKTNRQKDEDMLHLTMHNILLQGIIGHMDLNEVYSRVNSLMKNLNIGREDQKDAQKPEEHATPPKPHLEETKTNGKPSLEDKFVAELIRCNDLQDEIINGAVKTVTRKTSLDLQSSVVNPKTKAGEDKNAKTPAKAALKSGPPTADVLNAKLGPKVLIKTVIDINSIGERNDTISKDNIHGIIELTYNGKSMKFSRPDMELKENPNKKPALNIIQPKYNKINKVTIETTTQTIIDVNSLKKIPKDYLNRFVTEYFKHFPLDSKEPEATEETKEAIDPKRLKRHVKVKFPTEESIHLPQRESTKANRKNNEDDELYVEIETHFDSKGMKGEKKKKLIRSLIEKIQKAIHEDEVKKLDDANKNSTKKKKPKHLHVKKRMQNPLEHKDHVLINKYGIPLSSIVHRQLNPIPKTIPMEESFLNVRDRSGESWKKEYIGPAFLTETKSINSAEMSELDVDYNKVLDVNGIPQRLQKPLNTDMSEETMNSNSFYDLGNMKFVIKDVDGSGFAVGFNQYVDEPPDPEAIKLFTGLENVIKTYHQTYDQSQPTEINMEAEEVQEPAQNKNDHLIVRRSIDKSHDHHSNEYRVIFDGQFLPYNSYKDIYERETTKHTGLQFSDPKSQFRSSPLVVDANIFDKNLKPAEIFGLANLFQRKKRSLNVRKISNLKGKIKMNRYLNTKAMSTKRIFLNRKRNKRQINKIRIIASDMPQKQTSDENVFVFSDENVFADRAIVKEGETSEADPEKPEEPEYVPYSSQETPTYRVFDGKFRHNSLMSKYPHVFMEEISRSREEFGPDSGLLFGKIPVFGKLAGRRSAHLDKADDKESDTTTLQPAVLKDVDTTERIEEVKDIVEALQPPQTNYKVTVKIMPKNISSGVHSGFKEVHTSINKSFNKNGIIYSSLVNVSEISKVTKINKTKDFDFSKPGDTFLAKKIKDQQEKMQILLRRHQKHIDEQLHRLNAEKSKLDSILIDQNNTGAGHFDYIDLVLPAKPLQALHLSKDEMSKLPTDLHQAATTAVPSATSTTPPSASHHTVPSTSTTSSLTTAPVFNDTLKRNILTTIERNENLTDQILKKIDKNTEILQTFLKKLTDKIDTRFTDHKTLPPVEEVKTEKPEKLEKPVLPAKHESGFPMDWRNHQSMPQFTHNMVIRKNDSHISIPFVYAYQQPMLSHKGITPPTANVIYHGHIHPGPVHNKDTTSTEKEVIQTVPKSENNETRFFIDELESDYKVIPVNVKRQMIRNATKI